MVAPTNREFLKRTAALRHIALDSSSCIYYLRGVEPRRSLVRQLLDRARSGSLQIDLPGVVEMELLVRPYATRNPRDLMDVERLTVDAPGVTTIPISRDVMLSSAQTRAITGLKLPDALVVGSAIARCCDALIGNDIRFRILNELPPSRWFSSPSPGRPSPTYLHLDDYLGGR